MKLGVVIHASRPEPAEFARRLVEAAEARGHTVVGDEATARLLGRCGRGRRPRGHRRLRRGRDRAGGGAEER